MTFGTYCSLPPVFPVTNQPTEIPAAFMPKPQYGYDHQKARAEALVNFRDGMICWRCKRPMRSWQRLDLDHVVPVAMGGTSGVKVLVHAYCNRSQGAALGNRMRKIKGVRRSHRRHLPKW